jgi:hypothetical protein
MASTSYEAPHYEIVPILLLFHPSSVQIFFSATCSQIPSVYVLTLISETKFHTNTKLQAKLLFLYILIFTVFRQQTRCSELNDSKHYLNSVSSEFSPESNFDFLVSFSNIWTMPDFQRICRCVYVMILPCILALEYQHIRTLRSLCVYF